MPHMHVQTFELILHTCIDDTALSPYILTQLQHDYFRIILEPPAHYLRCCFLQRVLDFLLKALSDYEKSRKNSLMSLVATRVPNLPSDKSN